jgi:hypothetical protein
MTEKFDCSILFIIKKKKKCKKDGRQHNKFNPYFIFVKHKSQEIKQNMIRDFSDHIRYRSNGNPIIAIPMINEQGNLCINTKTGKQKIWTLQKHMGNIWINMSYEEKRPYYERSDVLFRNYLRIKNK